MWRTWIKHNGIRQTAKDLKIEYESVRRWVVGICLPSDILKKKLIKLAKGEFGYADFFTDVKISKKAS